MLAITIPANIFTDVKTTALAENIGIPVFKAGYHVITLFGYCAAERKAFHEGMSARMLAAASDYTGDAIEFRQAMRDAGWITQINEGIGVPEFSEFNRDLLARKVKEPEILPVPVSKTNPLQTVADLGAYWSFNQKRRFRDQPDLAAQMFQAMIDVGWTFEELRAEVLGPLTDWSDSFGAWKFKAEKRRTEKHKHSAKLTTAESVTEAMKKLGW